MAFTSVFLSARLTGRAYHVTVTEHVVERLRGKPSWLPYRVDERYGGHTMRRGRPEPIVRVRETTLLDATFEFDRAPSVAQVLEQVVRVCSDGALPAGPDMAVCVAAGELPGQLRLF